MSEAPAVPASLSTLVEDPSELVELIKVAYDSMEIVFCAK